MKPPIQSRTDLATWIEFCVLGDLRTLLAGVDTYYASPSHLSIDGRPLGSANFLLVAGCCSALDYFGFPLQRRRLGRGERQGIHRPVPPAGRLSLLRKRSDHLAVLPSWHGPPQLAKTHFHRGRPIIRGDYRCGESCSRPARAYGSRGECACF
jgi:hypothetical protein